MVSLHQQLEESVKTKQRQQRRMGRDEFWGRRGSDLTRVTEEQGKTRASDGNDWGRSEYFPRRSCEIVRQVSDHMAGKQAPSNRGDGEGGLFRRKRTDLTNQAEALMLFQQAQKNEREEERRRNRG